MSNQHKKSQEITIREISTTIKASMPKSKIMAAQHLFDRKVKGVDIKISGLMSEGHTLVIQMNDDNNHGLFELSLDQALIDLATDFKAQADKKDAAEQAACASKETQSVDGIEFDDYYPIECCSCKRAMKIAPSRAHKLGLFDSGLADCNDCQCVMTVQYDPAANKLIPSIKTH